MWKKHDLVGLAFGSLTVLRAAGPDGSDRQTWVVCCSCGKEETYPQRRLLQDSARRPAVRACSYCERPTCVICGARFGLRGPRQKTTCGPGCATVKSRGNWNAYYHRCAADPELRSGRVARVKARRLERGAEELAQMEREKAARRRQREAIDPVLRERRLEQARQQYDRTVEEVARRRRERKLRLSPEALEAKRAAASKCSRRHYALRKKPRREAAPEAYRQEQAEYRRRRLLETLLTTTLPGTGGQDDER